MGRPGASPDAPALHLRIRTGGRAGEVRRFREDVVDVGRAEGVGLRFDPESDLHVSGRHARLQRRDGQWWVRDLDSRNGTFVDGDRIQDWVPLAPGRTIRFGWEGPEIEVLAPGAAAPEFRQGPSRMAVGATALGLVAIAAVLVASGRAREAERAHWEEERTALVARIDSALAADDAAVDAAVDALEGEVEGLADALLDSRRRVQAFQRRLDALAEAGETDQRELQDLRAQIDDATATISGQRRAAALDAPALLGRIRPAAVMVYTEFANGERSVASGFAIEGRGRIVTNRHVVAGADGDRRVSRVGVQFSGSPQVWPAQVERMSPRDDLALLRIQNLRGENPTVTQLNARTDTLARGTPVLMVGFPGTEPAGATGPLPRAVATAGRLIEVGEDRLELEGWGAAGASGSPVVDADGTILGVLFGALGSGDPQRLVAVPAARLLAFLGEG
ncbi:MAG: trypsin-like peptidase domain-containing protein [Gemmatimonadetes bacterium]|nr:trypsin-like peptidase domain-containing protein [Gemmatimonadota bacterium]MBT8405478.1 trypsin-like peptidase domain-containing protein [Gemmatimonadota bacterium]